MLKLISWNVNGLRAVHRKGLFLEWLAATQPDILALQETKCHPDQLPPEVRQPDGYMTYWASAERPGYSGVALYTRRAPLSVQIGLGSDDYDREGRTLVADFGDFVLINAYFPNGGRDHARVPFKMRYKADFLTTCNNLRAAGRAVVFCGDVNTSHQDIDLARPRQNRNTTGFLPEERAWMTKLLGAEPDGGLVDVYRRLQPETTDACYTWWSNRGQAYANNVGWRLDYHLATPQLAELARSEAIYKGEKFSDHAPITVGYDLVL